MPFIRVPYDFADARAASDAYSIDFSDAGDLAHQSFKDDCDINRIVARLDTQGFLDTTRGRTQPIYFDAASVPDFQSALNQVIIAQDHFDSLPASVRERFANDPARFVNFMSDNNNLAEAQRLGLVPLPEAPDVGSVVAPITQAKDPTSPSGSEA